MSQLVKKIRTSSGDLQIDYNSLANAPMISNPNILINGEFLVWQRGEIFNNIIGPQYTADRWCIRSAKSRTSLVEKSSDVPNRQIMRQSIHIKETIEENTYLSYYFEQQFKGTFTLSFWYKTSAPFNTYFVDDGEPVHLGKLETLNEWAKAVFTFDATYMTSLNLIQAMSIGDTYIAGVKLEYGSIATEFIPRQPAEELALCQRFFYRIASICPMFMTQQALSSKSYSNMSIPLPVSLRSQPTVEFSNVQLIKNGTDGTSSSVIKIECAGWSRIGVTLKMYISESYDTGKAYFLMMSSDGYITLDSEVYPVT